MHTIETYECALFNEDKEIFYSGYHRVIATFIDGMLADEIVFPESQQDEPVYATHIVVIDDNGNEKSRKQL